MGPEPRSPNAGLLRILTHPVDAQAVGSQSELILSFVMDTSGFSIQKASIAKPKSGTTAMRSLLFLNLYCV